MERLSVRPSPNSYANSYQGSITKRLADAAHDRAQPSRHPIEMRRLLLVLMFLALFAVPAFAQNFDFPNSPTANQIITGPSGQSLKWDGTKWVAEFGGGVGAYLPLAGGTMTGTIVGSDGGSWATTGLNNVKALGIGAAAPTVAGGLAQMTATGNRNAYIQITNTDNTDTQAYSTYYLTNGTHYGAMQLANLGANFNGPNVDNLSIQTSAANGINLVTNASTAHINFFVNTLANLPLAVQQGGLQLGGTGPQGPYVYFQPYGQPNAWAALSSGAGSNLNVSAGGHFDGTNWIADNAIYHDISLQSVGGSSGFNFYENNGLTVGAAFTPNQEAQLGAGNGWNNGLHLGLSAQQVYSCYNSYPNIPNNGQVVFMHSGIWGASAAGTLTGYSTYSGAVTMTVYGISSFGSPMGNSIGQIITNDYGGGGAHFTVTQVGASDGGGNPYLQFVYTNTSGTTASFYYWYTQTGGGSTMYCQ